MPFLGKLLWEVSLGIAEEHNPDPFLLWVRTSSSTADPGTSQARPWAEHRAGPAACKDSIFLSQTPLQTQLSEEICWLWKGQVPTPRGGYSPHREASPGSISISPALCVGYFTHWLHSVPCLGSRSVNELIPSCTHLFPGQTGGFVGRSLSPQPSAAKPCNSLFSSRAFSGCCGYSGPVLQLSYYKSLSQSSILGWTEATPSY